MNNWQEKLQDKFNQIKKEDENNVHIRSDIRFNIRNSNRRNGSIRLSECNKEIINIKKEENKVITAKGAFDDYEAICKEEISDIAKLVKVMRIILKLLVSIRTNQMGGVRKEEQQPPKK